MRRESDEHGQVHRVHTASDLENYSGRFHDQQRFAQEQLDGIQRRAATYAHVDRENAIIQRGGDGDLTRWPAEVTAADLLADYVPALHAELLSLNGELAPDRRLRLRLAVTSGTSEQGAYGLVGTAPVNAARLVDAQVVREELLSAPAHPFVVIVDDAIFHDVVEPRVRHLDPTAYRSVLVTNKTFERTAWVSIPGRADVGAGARTTPTVPAVRTDPAASHSSQVHAAGDITANGGVIAGRDAITHLRRLGRKRH
ncbi:hypothetical protein [Amycolatopsis magusensis]|uniref:hypothetical protein n=1 Tax=Amycolatopsis magusensis TaxID=882444 RepID=UPI0024A7BD0F|nr:hypothetical protein [Amycolatopsis magusensis]MDI5974996.1 hypothetical protein [Amycolatopsis magusensis]